jgi:hypothetical protein
MSELRKPYQPGKREEIPAGLEYRPEMWDSALGLIENHEKVVFRRKLIVAAGVVLLLALGTGFWDRNVSSDGAQMAQQQDVFYAELRDSQDRQSAHISESNVQDVAMGSEYESNFSSLASIPQSNDPIGTITALHTTSIDEDELIAASEPNVQLDESLSQETDAANSDEGSSLPQSGITENTDDESNGALVDSQQLTAVEEQASVEESTSTFEDAHMGQANNETELVTVAAEDAAKEDPAQDQLQAPADDNNENKNLTEGILSEDATVGVQSENPIPLNIKQVNGEDSPLQYEPFAEGAPAPHAFSTEFMRLGQEPRKMNPRPCTLIANSKEFKKPQGIIVNLKQKELLLPLQQFNVQVMLGASILSHYGSRKRELALSPVAGVGVDYNFKRRLSLNAQLQYFSVKNIQRDRVVVQEEIDFALSTTTFTYNTEKLHYISVPLNFAIRLKNRHQFSFGGGISYLIAANNKVKIEEESSLNQANVSEFQASNVSDGFAPITSYLNFGYNYYVTPNVTVGLRYQAGLTDVTLDNSELFIDNRKDRNTRLAAYLRFNVL